MSISANDSHSPALTRRSLLAGAAGAAVTVAAGSAADPAAAASEPDAPLPLLAPCFADALAAYQAADRHRTERESWYLTHCPHPPKTLTAKGPLGKLLRHKRSWWYADGLEELLRDRGLRRHWRAARAALPLAQAYEAEVKEFERACGFTAAETAHEAAVEALEELSHAILQNTKAPLPPRTCGPRHPLPQAGEGNAGPDLRLLALKARVLKAWSRPDMWSDDPGHADAADRALAEICDAVMGMDAA
jgi:hypothetical protein